MQDYIKKYFWLVGVITVMICAVFAAKSFNHVVEGRYLGDSEEPAKVETPKTGPRTEVKTRSKSGEPVAQRNMFCSTCEPEVATPTEPTEPTDPNSVPYTSLPLTLLATNIAPRDEHSFATIRNTSNASQGAYWVSMEIPSAGKVEKITGKYVDFRNSATNRLERISLLGETRPPPAAKPAEAETRPPPAGDGDELTAMIDNGVKQVSEDNYEIDRGLVDKLLENPMSVARGARIVPSVKDGKANGFKLYAIRPSSVYAKIGLRNGDTVTSINGFELTTPDKALEVYTKVREASNLSVSIIRRGQPTTINYNIR